MNLVKRLCLGAAFGVLPTIACAADLSIVEVAASEIACAFEPGCAAVNPNIFPDFIAVPGITGTVLLRSQTFLGKLGTPAEGKTGYEYQVDMSKAVAMGDFACITDLHVDVGVVFKLSYDTAGPASDVFIVSKGGLGTIGLSSAVQNGTVISFTFARPNCAGEVPGRGHVSSVFGLTSAAIPRETTAKVGIPGADHVRVKALTPTFQSD